MRRSFEFLLGLLERDELSVVAQEDWDGEHGTALRIWQELGFVDREPGMHPVASCPHCDQGVPYRLDERLLCHRCHSTVDPRQLLLWRLDLTAFLRWIAGQWRLKGSIRRLDAHLWQLGTWESASGVHECFYRRDGAISEAGRRRVAAFRQAFVLCGASLPSATDSLHCTHLSLLELLRAGEALALADPVSLLLPRGNVLFDASSGALWTGETCLGEVPVGSRECCFLACLAGQIDRFVPYQDIKAAVLRASGSRDATEEATFCQGLKSRIKKKWIPAIDYLVVTTNKADGYRLRGVVEG